MRITGDRYCSQLFSSRILNVVNLNFIQWQKGDKRIVIVSDRLFRLSVFQVICLQNWAFSLFMKPVRRSPILHVSTLRGPTSLTFLIFLAEYKGDSCTRQYRKEDFAKRLWELEILRKRLFKHIAVSLRIFRRSAVTWFPMENTPDMKDEQSLREYIILNQCTDDFKEVMIIRLK